MDRQESILEQVRDAFEAGSPLAIRGGGSKGFYAAPPDGERLDVSNHSGIVDYDPGELVVTCRAGTPLAELKAALAENGQHLPFEPPAFGEHATIGGTVSCGFSGPRRPWAGSLRDYLLGVRIVNGRGQALRFGGQVMKNVAGYDVSRLMAGSLGTLGVILETSFKVLPVPASERTLRFEFSEQDAIDQLAAWCGKPLPVSASCWLDGLLYLRLSGAESETSGAGQVLGGETVPGARAFWDDLREQRHPFFESRAPLWRLSLPSNAPRADLDAPCLAEWGGAQRWYTTPADAAQVREAAASAGGHATLFRGETAGSRFHPQPEALQRLQERLRLAFDPKGLLNPGLVAPGA